MLGKKTGVATRFLKDNAAAIPIHCCAHSLNLCLQDAGRKFPTLRDALESVREVSNLIRYSQKDHICSQLSCYKRNIAFKVSLYYCTNCSHWSYCQILWFITRNLRRNSCHYYRLKAGGLLQSLEKFNTLFGLKLSYLIWASVTYSSEESNCTTRSIGCSGSC